MTDIPIACALDAAELAARRDGLLPGLAARALGREALVDGYGSGSRLLATCSN